MMPSVPQSITQILSHRVACVSLARGSNPLIPASFFLSFVLSFNHLYDVVASSLRSRSILPPFVFTPLIPHRSSGRLVDWMKERLVPGGPAEWRCNLNKGAF